MVNVWPKRSRTKLALSDGATVVVIGGGPAGSFFALRLLQRAREKRKQVNVVILERKSEVCFYGPVSFALWEGCNYCAGGLSPRLVDALRASSLEVPEDIVESRAVEVVVHADWKSIQLYVPEGREMISVFRGSRPRQRVGRYVNFDTWLLNRAAEEGAQVVTAEAVGLARSSEGKPLVYYRLPDAKEQTTMSVEADLLVLALGVNRRAGLVLREDPLVRELRKVLPRFSPPRVRRAVIAEMTDENKQLGLIEGEVHFAQYGSKGLRIEMASVMPKREWLTTAILGKSVHCAEPGRLLDIVERFLDLPNIRRLIPHRARLRVRCLCHPNMTVGIGRGLVGERAAVVGDLAISRLYKDGLYSAFLTSSALADCCLEGGIDQDSLKRGYMPLIRRVRTDNRYGRLIFALSRFVLAHPTFSRILYRAVITERMTKPRERHCLASVVWNVASGDDSYRRVLLAMLHPRALWRVFRGGVLLTARDVLTERFFGLDWTGIPRYMTGVPLEEVEATRRAVFQAQGLKLPTRAPHMERIFTIRIRASKQTILRQLGSFGDPDRRYLKPRFIDIRRVKGEPNHLGTVIRYEVPLARVAFEIVLEKVEPEHYLLYRIVNGLGTGGILAFLLDELRPGVSLLTIYVGFDFPRGRGLGRLGWAIARHLFPEFAHDVVWNHSLCQIRHLAETEEEPNSPEERPSE